MFLGKFFSQVSKKGRVALPAKFRQETGKKIVITRWYESCLVIVGQAQLDDLLLRFARKDEVVIRPIRSVERFILAMAFEVDIDDQGRFVIPPLLREAAKIKDKVVFLGLGEKIELWNQELWEKEEAKVKAEAEDMLEALYQRRKR